MFQLPLSLTLFQQYLLYQYNYDIHDAVMKDVNVMMHYLLESTVNFSKICRSRHWSLPRVLVPKLV